MTTKSILTLGKAAREVGNKHLLAANPELVKHVQEQYEKEFEKDRAKLLDEISSLKDEVASLNDVIAANDLEIANLKAQLEENKDNAPKTGGRKAK